MPIAVHATIVACSVLENQASLENPKLRRSLKARPNETFSYSRSTPIFPTLHKGRRIAVSHKKPCIRLSSNCKLRHSQLVVSPAQTHCNQPCCYFRAYACTHHLRIFHCPSASAHTIKRGGAYGTDIHYGIDGEKP